MNEENKKVKKEKKPITFKTLFMRRFIFLIIFAIIIGGTTTYFIIKNKPTNKQPQTGNKETILDNEVPTAPTRNHTSLINYDNDTFDCNALKITEIYEPIEGYDASYFQIDGLKDKNIQDTINNNLKNDLVNAITENKANGNIKGEFYVTSNKGSNFANTLSIAYTLDSYMINTKTGDYDYFWVKTIAENYDLTTGNRIKIQDIFTDDTKGSDIFDNNFYNELVRGYTKTEIKEDALDMVITDYKDIEEKILEYILKFDAGEDIPFYFTEQEIVFPDNYIRIFYEDHLDFVAIYNRYKSSENIFDGKYPAITDLPVLTKRYQSDYQILDEGENYYIDLSLENSIFRASYSEKVVNSVINYIKDDAESMRSNDSDSKFYVYNGSYFLYKYQDYDAYSLSISIYKKETTKSLFNSEIKPQIYKAFRTVDRIPGGEARLYNNQFIYYLYDDEDGYDKVENDWETESYDVYLDSEGNVYETEAEAKNPGAIEIKD